VANTEQELQTLKQLYSGQIAQQDVELNKQRSTNNRLMLDLENLNHKTGTLLKALITSI